MYPRPHSHARVHWWLPTRSLHLLFCEPH
jgi:hypothetical protein